MTKPVNPQPLSFKIILKMFICHSNKAGYTATPVAFGWAGAIFEVTIPIGQEQ